jgi:hypothetical protein
MSYVQNACLHFPRKGRAKGSKLKSCPAFNFVIT